MKIALVGTRGVPAQYGGFETCVEEVGRRLVAAGHDVIVYCRSSRGSAQPSAHLGMRLVHLPCLQRRSLETLSHTGLSVAHLAVHHVDVAFMFNAANAPLLPIVRAARIPVATHVDGLEWQRAKWGRAGKRYYHHAEALAVRWSDALIADAPGIQRYYRERFGVGSELISYGAPAVAAPSGRINELGLLPQSYHLVVARFEPENNLHLIVEGYVRSAARLPLIVVGSAPYSDDYTARVHNLADERVRFLGGIWDQGLLDQLYAESLLYWHGHSVGGTNPSLLRAVGAGAAVNAYDVDFNRDVLGDVGHFFRDERDVAMLVDEAESSPQAVRQRAAKSAGIAERYDWDEVSAAYLKLADRLRRDSGRRR